MARLTPNDFNCNTWIEVYDSYRINTDIKFNSKTYFFIRQISEEGIIKKKIKAEKVMVNCFKEIIDLRLNRDETHEMIYYIANGAKSQNLAAENARKLLLTLKRN